MQTDNEIEASMRMTAENENIEDRVCRARQGDPDTICTLLTHYRPLLAQTIRRSYLSGSCRVSWIDREGLWQDGAYALLLLIQSYQPGHAVSFSGFVRVMLPWHFRAIQRVVERSVQSCAALDEAVLSVPDPGDGDAQIVVRDLLSRLSPTQRRVIAALYLDERAVGEIAAELRLTERAVRATRQRALHVLGQQIIVSLAMTERACTSH